MRLPQNPQLRGEILATLTQLARAADYAAELQIDRWQFAVPLRVLLEAGTSESCLRWMVLCELAEHGSEVATHQRALRKFRAGASAAFNDTSCFVLTECGAAALADNDAYTVEGKTIVRSPIGTFYSRSYGDFLALDDLPGLSDQTVLLADVERKPTPRAPMVVTVAPTVLPEWDPKRQVLKYGGKVVKGFHQKSSNQVLVLAAFQELGWPHHMDDPLVPVKGIDPKHRLRFTIWRLNNHQENRLIKFLGDGTGQGIRWKHVL
jgi:hypothetical protein